LFQSKYKFVYLLNEHKISQIALSILKFRGIILEEKHFFTGTLNIKNDAEAVHIKAFKKTSELSIKWSKEIVDENSILSSVNSKYGNNTLQLHFAKFLQSNLMYWLLRIYSTKALSDKTESNIILYIRSPNVIEEVKLRNAFPEIKFIFYGSLLNQKTSFLYFLFKEIYLAFIIKVSKLKQSKKLIKNVKKPPSVLTIQEDSIRFDQSIRGHLHWLDFELHNFNNYPVNVISLNHGTSKVIKDTDLLKQKNIHLHSSKILSQNITTALNFKNVKMTIKLLWLEAIRSNFSISTVFIIKSVFLFYKAIKLASVCVNLNVKVYVIREPYFILADAIQLLSNTIGVKTIAYQYSNLGFCSPLMMTSSDLFLTFSTKYYPIFKLENLGPKELKSIGYINEGVEGRLVSRVKKLKGELIKKGVKFTVAYFDESIKEDKYGLISVSEYRDRILKLSRLVANDPSLGVIIKTQFIGNLISKRFSLEAEIMKAIKTGRLVEVFAGEWRNDVYPLEVALASDICINESIGATAGLEAANAGVRCLLLNGYGYKNIHSDVYNKADIIYNSFSAALSAIEQHRQLLNNSKESLLGDWSKIISHFTSTNKIKGISAIRSEVEKALKLA
jgi:hypothetical protein